MVSEAFVDTYASIYLWEEAYLADEKKIWGREQPLFLFNFNRKVYCFGFYDDYKIIL